VNKCILTYVILSVLGRTSMFLCCLQASLAAWVTILRIMGDLPEVDYGESFAVAGVSIYI
jgi:hypothetical protein